MTIKKKTKNSLIKSAAISKSDTPPAISDLFPTALSFDQYLQQRFADFEGMIIDRYLEQVVTEQDLLNFCKRAGFEDAAYTILLAGSTDEN